MFGPKKVKKCIAQSYFYGVVITPIKGRSNVKLRSIIKKWKQKNYKSNHKTKFK